MKTEPSRELKDRRLEIPKVNLPLYTVSEETLQSHTAGVSWSSLSEGPGRWGRQWPRPAPLAEPAHVTPKAAGLLTYPSFPPPIGAPSMVVLSSEPEVLSQVT